MAHTGFYGFIFFVDNVDVRYCIFGYKSSGSRTTADHMTSPLLQDITTERFSLSLSTAIKFVGFGILWIVGSDMILFLTQVPGAAHFPLFHLEVLKGIGFVIVMGVFIFIVLRKQQGGARDISQQDLFEKNPQPMWVYNQKTLKFLAVNQAAVNLYGFSKTEFLSMTIENIRPKEDIARLHYAIDQLKDSFRHLGPFVHVKKDGTIIHAEVSSFSITYQQQPARLIQAADITHQVKAEQALVDSGKLYEKRLSEKLSGISTYNKELQIRIREINSSNDDLIEINKLLQESNNKVRAELDSTTQRYQLHMTRLMENVSDAVWSIDLSKPEETYISNSALKLFNTTRDSILDKPNFWEDHIHEGERNKIETILRNLEANSTATFTYRTNDKITSIWQRIDLIRDDAGDVQKIECIAKVLV